MLGCDGDGGMGVNAAVEMFDVQGDKGGATAVRQRDF